jgi:PRC-barrel domain
VGEPGDAVERLRVDEIMGWIGSRLDEIGGATVGRVEGAYVDVETEAPVWLLVKVGRFGRRSLVPARDAVAGAGHVWVPYPRDLLRGAPRVEPGEPLDLERERELSRHYEFPRAAELEGRPPSAPTSRPVS